jgi:hypothetical protein
VKIPQVKCNREPPVFSFSSGKSGPTTCGLPPKIGPHLRFPRKPEATSGRPGEIGFTVDEQVEFEVGRVDVDVERMKVGYQAIEDLRGGEWGIDRDVELERARIHDDSFGLTREALASMSPISTTRSRCELMQA